jgi:2-phosphosulfolactate phosphatase
MRIDIALLPGLIRDADSVFVVVDILRASSSIVALLQRGVPAIVPAASVEQARDLHKLLPDHLLCGEVNGLPGPGFDYGNSPTEFSALDAGGRPAILATSNGTRVLNQLAEAPAVLVGALLNREAVARAMLALAREHGRDATIVCASAPGGHSIALEDALGAGAIAEAALRLDDSPQPTDAARFARDAFLARRDDLAQALASARHGAELIEAGFGVDVEYCARLDVSSLVPRLSREAGGRLTLRPLSP